MKKSLSGDQADLLRQCCVSMVLDQDVMQGIQNRKAEAYDLLLHIYSQVNAPHATGCNHSAGTSCRCANS